MYKHIILMFVWLKIGVVLYHYDLFRKKVVVSSLYSSSVGIGIFSYKCFSFFPRFLCIINIFINKCRQLFLSLSFLPIVCILHYTPRKLSLNETWLEFLFVTVMCAFLNKNSLKYRRHNPIQLNSIYILICVVNIQIICLLYCCPSVVVV